MGFEHGRGATSRDRQSLSKSLYRLAIVAVSSTAIGIGGTASLAAQEQKEPPTKTGKSTASGTVQSTPASDDRTPVTKPAVKGRLPNNYAKLGVSTDQRKEIYTIQARLRLQIAALEKQIVQLKLEESRQVQAVLNDEQRQMLEKLEAAARERRVSRKGLTSRD